MQVTQTPVFELGESNIFEEFYELIEKHRLNASNKFEIEEFYQNLSNFDLEYQQFSTTSNEQTNDIIYSYISHCLYCFLILFKFNGFTDRPIYWAFNKYIKFSTILLKNSNKIKDKNFYFRNISQNFPSLWKGSYIDFLKKEKINFNLIAIGSFEKYLPLFKVAETNISMNFGYYPYQTGKSKTFETRLKAYCSNYEVLELEWNDNNDQFKEGNLSYEMAIDFKISDRSNDAAKLIQPLYLIINALSNINNVKVEMEEIEVGSLIGRFRLYIKDLLAKEETKAVLEAAKESVAKALTGGQVSYTEVKTANARMVKMQKEIRLLERQLSDKPTTAETKRSNSLSLEKLALENEQLRIKNERDTLELIEKISDLVAKGVLGVDEARININGILYLLKAPTEIGQPDTDIDELT